MQGMAEYGRNGDTMMAHVAPGEMVVPQEVLQNSPQIARGLGMAFSDVGADPLRYTVGSGQNSMNPTTGQPEFFFDKLIPFLTNAASNPMVQGAVGNAILRKVQGKDVGLRDLLLGGVGGATIGGFTGRGTGMSSLDSLLGLGLDSDANLLSSLVGGEGGGVKAKVSALNADPGGAVVDDAVSKMLEKKLGSDVSRAEGLLGIGEIFGTDPSKGIGKILNTKIGESLAFGLGSQLLNSVFPRDNEETDADRAVNRANMSYVDLMSRPNRVKLSNVRRPSGSAADIDAYFDENPYADSSVMRLNKGGSTFFPRRDGGIMPSEGSGTEDDVPAMLTAGEFVMTRDAVKGAGNGNLNNGINKMYSMMDTLERSA